MTKPIAYEPHPVSPERKAELTSQGYQIVDAIYAPAIVAAALPADESVNKPTRLGRPPRAKE